jgi:hypothetical protein
MTIPPEGAECFYFAPEGAGTAMTGPENAPICREGALLEPE